MEPISHLHAHVESYTTDCDGPIVREFVLSPNSAEQAGDFCEIEFHHRVLTQVVNTYSLMDTGTLTVKRDDDGEVRLSWSEPTDEGHRQVEARIHDDETCMDDPETYRDIRAEQAGY